MHEAQTPIIDLLKEVPKDIVLGISGAGLFPSYTNIPIGRLAHEAVDELRRLHAENDLLWKEREEPHKAIGLYMSECNRLERERDLLDEENRLLKQRISAIANLARLIGEDNAIIAKAEAQQ